MRSYVRHWLEHSLRADVAELLAPSWFTCVGLAGVVALILMLVLARRRGIDPGTVASAVLWCYIAAVGAGIVVPMAIGGIQHLFSTGHFQLRWAGMTSFWGYLGGAAAVALVCRRGGVSLARIGDLAVIPMGVALVFARIGCFLAGCDFGKVTSLPWAVRFPSGSPAWRDHVRGGLIPADRASSLPVHPTQLYEALLGLAIIAIAIFVARRKHRQDGHVFLVAAAGYAIGRIFIETLRGDLGRGIHAGVSSGQIFSLVVLAAIAAWFSIARRRAVTAVAAMTLVLGIARFGDAHAQPAPRPAGPPPPPTDADAPAAPRPEGPQLPPAPPDSQPAPEAPPQQPEPPAVTEPPPPAAQALRFNERPLYSTGLLFGVATSINRRADQVPTLAGASISLGYMPGRLGVWLDLDSYASAEAKHDTLIASGSYSVRPMRRLMIGARAGIGGTLVSFKDRAFGEVLAETFRLEAIAEYAFVRHWALWVRPLAIDTVNASELGGPITTYQFRFGVAYRFGSRRNARVTAPPPAPAAPPPPTNPTVDPELASEQSEAP